MKLDETYLIEGSVAPDFGDADVQLAKFQERSYVAGPGCRCVVWVAGCRRRCPGCFQSQFFDFGAGRLMSVRDLAAIILSVDDIDGVSFSGGEPFEQSAALGNVCEIIKRESGLSTLAYSGYLSNALAGDLATHGKFLEHLDILIDGAYEHELSGPYLWRGSSNQRINRRGTLSPADARTDDQPASQQIQVALGDDSLVLTGFPDEDVDRSLRQSLESRGILLSRPQR